MAALNKTDLDFLASLPASTAEPTEGTREQRRRAEDLPWGLLRQGRRTDLGDFVVAQRADLERLTAERAALLAPAGGVDLEEVLRRAARLGVADLGDLQGAAWCDMVIQVATAPALAREVARLRDHVRRVEASEKARMVEAEGLRADLEEARLTLAAEQGLEEGIPNGWHVTTRDGYGRPTCFAFTARPNLIVYKLAPADGAGWGWFYQGSLVNRMDRAPTARAAMLAADTATEAR